ncbi:hypothetical protein LC040_10275 [Bacillus tianshenii]|nr:hypothetical protein LC040_10275 [Bacillus tianshenii]
MKFFYDAKEFDGLFSLGFVVLLSFFTFKRFRKLEQKKHELTEQCSNFYHIR